MHALLKAGIQSEWGIKMEEVYTYKRIDRSHLLLDQQNPRIDPATVQADILISLIEDQKGKLLRLAKHIMKFGLNPMDPILVCPYENDRWLVLEGNRRVAALRLIDDPSVIPEGYGQLKRGFIKLQKQGLPVPLKSVMCVIVENRNLANEWIRLKHMGESDGAGTVKWDSIQVGRFKNSSFSHGDYIVEFLDHLLNDKRIPEEYREQFRKIKKTNLARLLEDPEVRSKIGVKREDGFLLVNGMNEVLFALLHDLSMPDFKVANVYHKEDRAKYMKKIEDQSNHGIYAKIVEEIRNSTADNKESRTIQQNEHLKQDERRKDDIPASTGMGETKRKAYPIQRRALIPRSCKWGISQSRIAKIFQELKSLDVEKYPNAVAGLFRVFVELSLDHYIQTQQLSNVNIDATLNKKIECVTKDLEDKRTLSKHELYAARCMASNATGNTSIRTFHAYVHNMNMTPNAMDLKAAWDDLTLFLEEVLTYDDKQTTLFRE